MIQDEFKSTQEEDINTDYLTLLAEVFKRVDERTAKFLTSSLLFVAILHVVSDKRLFLEHAQGPIENIIIVARAKNWCHAKHIPMPRTDGTEFFQLGPPRPSNVAAEEVEKNNREPEPMVQGSTTEEEE